MDTGGVDGAKEEFKKFILTFNMNSNIYRT